jgi:hypothetical protein
MLRAPRNAPSSSGDPATITLRHEGSVTPAT